MGGFTFKGTSRINKEDISKTLDNLYDRFLNELGLTTSDIRTLGSVYKKPTSGDIDILLDGTKISKNFNISKDQVPKFIYDKLTKVHGQFETNFTAGLKVSNIKFPIAETDKFVQIDLMTSFGPDCLELGEFIYYSSANSKYSGAHRTSLIYTILRFVDIKYLEYFEDGSVKTFEKYSLLPHGLVKQRKTLQGKRGPIKSPINLKDYEQVVATNPADIVNIMLGVSDLSITESFENLYNFIESGQNKVLYEKRKEIYKDWMNSFGKGLLIPDEFLKNI